MKTTLKEKVLQFVEQRGSARFTDIQRFIVDHKFGQGTYDNTKSAEKVWVNGKRDVRLVNPYRGYHSSSLTTGGKWSRTGYFLTGPDHLVKGDDGRYRVVRTTERKVEPVEEKSYEPLVNNDDKIVSSVDTASEDSKDFTMINLYKVDGTTGKIERIQRPEFDRSWMTNPHIFDDELTAILYAEPINEEYCTKQLTEDKSNVEFQQTEESIAEEMLQEFEVKVPYDFDEQNKTEPEKDLNLHDVIKSMLPVKAGQEIFVLDYEEDCIARMYKTTVTEVRLYVTENETTYKVITSDNDALMHHYPDNNAFDDILLGKEFFTDKQSCLVALNELF